MTRRSAIALLSAAGAVTAQHRAAAVADIVRSNDERVANYIKSQNTDPSSRWRGAIADVDGLHQPGSAGRVLAVGVAAYLHQESKFHQDPELRRRIQLASDHLARLQTPDGNFNLLSTNFNSPPDLAFIMLNAGTAASLARKHNEQEIFSWMEPWIRKAGDGLARGGVHTPNHRWVTCAALAQVNGLFPAQRYLDRIDQWLAEGIDIDADGQYSEQSTAEYNAVSDNALAMVAEKLDRPELLDPVRRNLEAMLLLLHPGLEVVTEISRRQDRNTVGDMSRYWFSLRCLARKDADGRYETLVRSMEPQSASLAFLMDFPALQGEGPAPSPLPDDYEKSFPQSNFVHIRRGQTSASLILRGNSRFFACRRGAAIIHGVRFASAFFGKGQFTPTSGAKQGDRYVMEQSLEGPYFQPFEPPRKQPPGVDAWYELRPQRKQTEVAKIRYSAEVLERKNGFDVRIRTEGTDDVPIAVEINLREGGEIEGVTALPGSDDVYLLGEGEATFRRGGDEIRFGPGIAETRYTAVRGALPKLPGPSVYLTAFTPFDHTLRFRW